jgi:protein subunit release factor B
MVMTKEEIVKNVKITTEKQLSREKGGQHTNGPDNSPVILTSEELEFEVKIGFYRSHFKNRQLAYQLFELYIDEVVKL